MISTLASCAGSPAWTVLLIGGSSGTGKTWLAEAIGRRVGVPWLQVDDVRFALQRVTAPAQHPDLHAFLAEDVWRRPPEELLDRFVAVGDIVSHALEIVVANHVATDAPLILEGDGIVPALAALRTVAGRDAADRVRSVFLVESDERAILDAMLTRGRGFDALTTEERIVQARTSWRFGQWLHAEADHLALPVVDARPWASIVDRTLVEIGERRLP